MSKKSPKIIPETSRFLCIDGGSSRIKAYEYYRGHAKLLTQASEVGALMRAIRSHTAQSYDAVLIYGHRQWSPKLEHATYPAGEKYELSFQTVPGNFMRYSTPETLGLDRYLACLGAAQQLRNEEAVVVIDAGTACTIDFMWKEGIYEGGVIMPGLQIWEEGLRDRTPQLPSVDRIIPKSHPGKTTRSCLEWGLMGSFAAAIRYHIYRYEEELTDRLKVMVTGGDGEDLLSPLQLATRQFDEYLVPKGMVAFFGRFLAK